jgi:transcriptional regulator with XRE-family HTH domain
MSHSFDNGADICRRMRQIREQAHMTQEKLADELGVSVNYLGEVERGRKALSHSLANRFCSYFHISYDYLYRGIPSADWDLLPFMSESANASSWRGVRESSEYSLPRNALISQLTHCSDEEIEIISRLTYTYLYTVHQQEASQQQKPPVK